MNHQLVIVKRNDKVLSCLLEDKNLVQINATDGRNSSVLGNIYIGKVKNIVKNINAAFVEIADGIMGYYSLEENKTPIFVNAKKNDKVNIGDEILVQVEKEGVKTKAPVLTSHLNFVGKYAVLTYGKLTLGVSNKITDEPKKQQFKQLLQSFKNEEYGLVVRTNAKEATLEQITEEIQTLHNRFHMIKEFGVHKTCFSCLMKSPSQYLCDIRDGYDTSIQKIVTDDMELYEEIKEYMTEYQPMDLNKLVLYEDKMISLTSVYSIETKLEKALQQRVWLKSGGYLVIEPTEALVVIDVNTGKATAGKKNAEETFFRVNMEAAVEIAKQIRLRNLSGIIIIDFIDVKSQEKKEELMARLRELLSKDPVRTIVVDMTPLNLVEVTRKKVRKPLYEQLTKEK